MKNNYYAVITANVRYDKRLTPNAKLLYAEITALTNQQGYAWATNSYFAELYEVDNVTISRWINQLVKYGYIITKMIYKEGTKQIEKRFIYINDTPINNNVEGYKQNSIDPINKSVNTPINNNVKDNTTITNTTINNTSNKSTSRSKLKFETHHLQLAELLFSKMKENNPNVKKPNFDNWANTFRLMMERDNRDGKDIQEMIVMSQNHEFWHRNILSADALRKQFDKLYLEKNPKVNKSIMDIGYNPEVDSF